MRTLVWVANPVLVLACGVLLVKFLTVHPLQMSLYLVDEAQVPDGFPLINLGTWNDDPIVIQAIKDKIDEQVEVFG